MPDEQPLSEAAVEMFTTWPRGLEILSYILRVILAWNLPVSDDETAARHNAGVGLVNWLRGREETWNDPVFANQLRVMLVLDKTDSLGGEKPSGRSEGWHDSGTRKQRR